MKIGKTRIIFSGNPPQKLDADTIIVPANTMLWTGGGFAAEVAHAGGPDIEREALGNAPADIGTAVATDAGRLAADRIIHAVIAGQDLAASFDSIRDALFSALTLAGETNSRSLAVPFLSTGTHEMEPHREAELMIDTVLTFLLNTSHSLEQLLFVSSDPDIREILETTLTGRFTRHG